MANPPINNTPIRTQNNPRSEPVNTAQSKPIGISFMNNPPMIQPDSQTRRRSNGPIPKADQPIISQPLNNNPITKPDIPKAKPAFPNPPVGEIPAVKRQPTQNVDIPRTKGKVYFDL
ncbi:hypothetical protein DPMN_181294 [Dreissena polymorpha]|uniref:Uncharacterized protein n=1 Tax=Dreissena polymorpha TaxID=45954 RepID=A0A9D4I562_DREPO|nr:hypothetical protein DPMN_181294 [Dreissena polymorpha]